MAVGVRRLGPEQALLLGEAVDATDAGRQAEIDSELDRALPQLPRPLVIRLLRGARSRSVDGGGAHE